MQTHGGSEIAGREKEKRILEGSMKGKVVGMGRRGRRGGGRKNGGELKGGANSKGEANEEEI